MNRLLVVLSVLCLAVTAAAQTNPIAGTWTLVFDDEFNGTTLNTNLWNPSGWVDNPGLELETYYATNVVVTNGLLQLWVYNPSSGVYTSGKVTTMDKFWQKYGYFEASINVPRNGGFWPAWWLLKEPYNTNDVSEPDWPPEVDILEITGESGGAQTSISCNIFYGPNYPLSGGGGASDDNVSVSISDATTGFHTYGYQWTPTSHTFYQDGVSLGSISAHPYTLYPMWAILQMAIRSTPSGSLPAAMQVDYVRIWALTNQLPPIITSQPSTQTVLINTPATFSVTCTNALSYQWTMAGTNVAGATSSTWTYTPSAVQTQRVSVVVTNAYGGIQSGFVQLQAQAQSGPLAQIGVSPANASVAPGGQQQFSATGADLLGEPLVPQPSFTWSVTGGGTIDGTGLFTAGSLAGGPFNVTAASGGITGVASVSVVTASGGTIGNTQEGTSTDTMWNNGAWINLGRFQAGSNLVVSTMFAKVGAASGGYKCAIYTDNGGNANTLLGGTAEVRGPTNGWNVFPLTSLITLTNGQYYWLAIWSDDANAQVYYSDTSGTLRWGQYNYGTWPNPITTIGGSTLDYCVYATGIAAPVASFVGSPTAGVEPLLVTFTDNSTGTITSRFWDFGDGATSDTTSTVVAHTYAVTGTNTVVLTVSGPVGTNSLSRAGYIVVTSPPAQIAVTPDSLGFGPVVIGQINSLTFQVVNNGGQTLNGTAATAAPFSIGSGSPFSVAPGQTGQVAVAFAPTSALSYSNAVVFSSNGGNNTNTATGSGLTGPLAQIGVSPANANVAPGGQQQFSATGADLLGEPLVPQPSFTWSVTGGGTIDGTGLFTAGSLAGGPFNVTAASGGITGVASVSVVTASGGTIGNTQEGTSTDTMWNNGAWINLGRFQAGSNLVVSTMFAKVGAASGGYKCAIYTDNGGNANTLLGGTAEVRGPTNGWNVFPLTSLITLTNGQYYWLAIWSDDANAQVYYSDTSGTLRWGQYNYGTWPNPITTIGGSTLDYCVYATGIAAPVASFVGSPTAGVEPLLVTFTDNSTGTITSRFWDFGDGATSDTTSTVVAHTYAVTGTNTVVLTVSGPVGTNSLSRAGYIVVTSPPAQIAVTPDSLGFGPVVIGQTNSLTFQVINNGGQTLNGTVAMAAPFSIGVGSPFSVAPGQTGQVAVVFAPTSALNYSNAVVFSSNGGNSTNPVTGTGAMSSVVIDAGSLIRLPDGRIQFGVTASAGATQATVWGTATLSSPDWKVLGTVPLTGGSGEFIDDPVPTGPIRFYRASVP